MKNIIQNILSVKNDKKHKIWTILGIKFKFKNVYGFINEEISILKNNNDQLQNIKQKISNLQKNIESIGNKVQKNFITDNIDNKIYFNFQQEIYNFYEEMKARKFSSIFQNRISLINFRTRIKLLEQRFNKKIFILTDMTNIPLEYNVIDIKDIENYKNEDYLIILAYNKDYDAIKAAKILNHYNIKYLSIVQTFPHARYFHIDKDAYETLLEESSNNNWHFCPVDFENIFQILKNCKDLEGDYVEIGTFRGDSASATLNYMKRTNINKPSFFIDTFVGFNYDEAYKSEDSYWQNTHTETSYEEVVKRLQKYDNVNVIKSNIITDDLPQTIEKICVANIDVDMYEAVKAALYKVKDKIVKNGVIIAEDFGHTPALLGAQKATLEFLEENPDMFMTIYMNSGQLLLIRK